MPVGQKYWSRAKQIIPGELYYSKSDLFLPNKWPAYTKKLDIKFGFRRKLFKYLSYMGVGTNILGYANQNVNSKFYKQLKMAI